MSEKGSTAVELLKQVAVIPSETDWKVYRYAKVELWSTAITAEEFGISQQEVCQCVKRVMDFVLSITPLLTKEDEARQLAASKQLAADRIEFLYGEALLCFHRSKGNETIVRQPHGHGKTGCTTTRTCYGDARYLRTASYLADLATRLPPLVCCQVPDSQPSEEKKPPRKRSNPTKEACSTPAAEPTKEAEPATAAPSATAAAMVSCVEQSRAESDSLNVVAHPVQASERKPLTNGQALRREAFFQT